MDATLRVVADENVDIDAPLSPILVVLHDNKVVAVSKPVDNTPPGVPPVQWFVATRYHLGPGRDYPVTVAGEATPCDGLTWDQIRRSPTTYSALALLPAQLLLWMESGSRRWLAAPVTLSGN